MSEKCVPTRGKEVQTAELALEERWESRGRARGKPKCHNIGRTERLNVSKNRCGTQWEKEWGRHLQEEGHRVLSLVEGPATVLGGKGERWLRVLSHTLL